MRVISVVNQKGGVGKTTLTRNLATLIAAGRRRVLVVDLDAQANLTLYSGLDPVAVQKSSEGMKAVMLQERSLPSVILRAPDGFDVAPSCLSFAAVELRIQAATDPNRILATALETVRSAYDVVLLDNAPALGRVVINSLVASDGVLIPAKTDLFSLSGFAFVLETIQSVQRSANPQLHVVGVVPNFFHSRMIADRTSLSELRRHADRLGLRVFDPLGDQTAVVKSTFDAVSAVSRYPDSQFAAGVQQIAQAIIDSSSPATPSSHRKSA